MPDQRTDRKKQLLFLALAATTLGNGGCLAAAAVGAAGGGAAAWYAYQRGLIYREYPATLVDASAAVRTSLTELGFPPGKEKSETASFTFETTTSDDVKVHVFLETKTSPIPVDGPVTRVTVRVGVLGRDDTSARILDQVSMHLVVPPSVQTPLPPPLARPTPPNPPESVAPPLAATTSASGK
jgi:hypothetical protein